MYAWVKTVAMELKPNPPHLVSSKLSGVTTVPPSEMSASRSKDLISLVLELSFAAPGPLC